MADLPPQWQGLRARRLGCAITPIAAILFWIAMSFVVDFRSKIVFYLVTAVGFGAMFVADGRLRRWPCPRCNRPFSVTRLWTREWPFPKTCRHCDLQEWAELPSRGVSANED